MRAKTHYEVLQVTESASAEVIRSAWLTLQRLYHPDRKAEGMTPDDQRIMCQLINEAYETLKDPARRAAYDQFNQASRRPVQMPGEAWSSSPRQYGYGEAYPAAYSSPLEFSQATLNHAARAAGSVFVDALLKDLPPEVRAAYEHLRRATQRRAG